MILRRLTPRLPKILLRIPGQTPIRRRHRPLRLRDLRMMPKISRQCLILLMAGHGLTFVPCLIHQLWPAWTYQSVDWFISPYFHYSQARYWYFKATADNILSVITFLILAKVSSKFSDTLFVVFVVFCGYHIIDTMLYWLDLNTQFWLYADLLWTALVLIKSAIFPYKPEKFARIKSFF